MKFSSWCETCQSNMCSHEKMTAVYLTDLAASLIDWVLIYVGELEHAYPEQTERGCTPQKAFEDFVAFWGFEVKKL